MHIYTTGFINARLIVHFKGNTLFPHLLAVFMIDALNADLYVWIEDEGVEYFSINCSSYLLQHADRLRDGELCSFIQIPVDVQMLQAHFRN